MKERSLQYFSEIGEELDMLREHVRGLSEYIAELEELIEDYHQLISTQGTPSTMTHLVDTYKLLYRTEQLIGSAKKSPDN